MGFLQLSESLNCNEKLTEGKRRAGIGGVWMDLTSGGVACGVEGTGELTMLPLESSMPSCKPEGLRYPSVSQSAGEHRETQIKRGKSVIMYPCLTSRYAQQFCQNYFCAPQKNIYE